MRIGWLELGFILLIVLVVLGPGKFTGIFKGIKKGVSNFRESISRDDEQ
ncbi:MAG TPA: twin-arginine translocase TatA/TatE family subunit [Oscillospiraceae bacterium]|nr:twin-arginine translocase TatA/TatE family subunit [Oscillospiraceae bacterium]